MDRGLLGTKGTNREGRQSNGGEQAKLQSSLGLYKNANELLALYANQDKYRT